MSANDEFEITDESLLDLLSHALQVTDPAPTTCSPGQGCRGVENDRPGPGRARLRPGA